MSLPDQNTILQKTYILATGSIANANEMASYNAMISGNDGRSSFDAVEDAFIQQLVFEQGAVVTLQAIAQNGFGVSLTASEAQSYINTFVEGGIDTGSKLLNHLSSLQGPDAYISTLDNRAIAASGFLESLNAAGKSDDFKGVGVTSAVHNLIQNIGSSSASLENGMSGFTALSMNLSATGITGTVADYLAGSIVFADSNRDGHLSSGEWYTTTSANGTFELPNNIDAGKISVYGGTDLLTGNSYQGVLGSFTGTTVVNPFTSVIESLITTGLAANIFDATTMLKTVLDLPADINLLSYNPLAVLSSDTATTSEKSVALNVQATSQQLSNIITQVASVIDNATAGATLQSSAAAVTIAIAQSISTAAGSSDVTVDLANAATLDAITQSAITATGTEFSSSQVGQIVQVTAGSNAAASAATTLTMLAQATDIAQGAATNALIAGVASGSFDSAVAGFTGSALTAANYAVTVGSSAPGVVLPPTVSQNVAADGAAAAAPTASLAYSTDGGLTSSSTAIAKDADTLRIIATFDKAVTDGTPTITIDNGVLVAVTAMAKTDSTHYYYDLDVPAGDIANAAVTIGGAHDATSATISSAPTNAVFAVDNTAPDAPTAVTLTPIGGTVIANTLNTTNTNMTATAAITAGDATGGNAVLKVGAATIATDSSILAGDTSVTFDLGLASTTALQAAIAAGGAVTVTLSDAAGNSAVSTVDNPDLLIDYTSPSAPTGVALTIEGGTVVPNSLNVTNTNMTAVASIVAGEATGGSAVLKIGGVEVETYNVILVGDTSVTFDLTTADNAALQAAVAAGGVATVTVTDVSGNSSVSTLSNPTLAVDYVATFTDLTTANEDLSGTGSNDTFTGTYGNGTATSYTFNTGDILDGLEGVDTLNITTGAEASTPPDNLWIGKTNFEKVVFNSIGNGAQVITTGANFEAAFAANGVNLDAQTLLGAIDVTMTSFTGAATIKTTTIGEGAHTITTGSGVSTVSATGIGAGAQTVNGAGLTTVNATINGAGDQVIGTTLGGDLVSVTASILGAGSQTITSTSNSNVVIVANAANGAQTITTAGGNDHVTTTGKAGQTATINTGAGNDVIISGLSNDVITAGTGTDTITGGGGTDRFDFGTDGSVIGTAMDTITDFNTGGVDALSFGAGTTVLPGIDATALVAGSNVNTSAGGLISFHADDNTLALKIIAIQADLELDAPGTVAMFVDGADTYVYYAGAAAGNVDDQLIELAGINTLITITAGAETVIS